MSYKPKPKGYLYWSAKDEILCAKWVTATTQQEYTRIYNALLGTMNHLVGNIMRRYFHVPPHKQMEVLHDVVIWVFLKLDRYDSSRQKAYTFCGTVAKNHMHEIIVRQPKAINKVRTEYTDENEIIENNRGIDYGSHTEHDLKAIIRYFVEKQLQVQAKIDKMIDAKERGKLTSEGRNHYNVRLKRLKLHVRVCELCQEFVEKHESVNANYMAEYVFRNTDMKRNKIPDVMKALFGFSATVYRETNGQHEDGKSYDIINDDWCPSEDMYLQRNKLRRIHYKR